VLDAYALKYDLGTPFLSLTDFFVGVLAVYALLIVGYFSDRTPTRSEIVKCLKGAIVCTVIRRYGCTASVCDTRSLRVHHKRLLRITT
jgi:hypothetical protein